jgi:hypothetical protein
LLGNSWPESEVVGLSEGADKEAEVKEAGCRRVQKAAGVLLENLRGQPVPLKPHSDVVLFGPTTYTFNMVFAVAGTEGRARGLIQMSPEHEGSAIMLKRVVKEWEEKGN